MSYGKGIFNTNIDSVNFGKILFYANAEYAGVGVDVENTEFRFKLVDPAGLTVRDYPDDADYIVPGGMPTGWQAANSEDIPLDSSGHDFRRGEYTLYVKVTISGNDDEYYQAADLEPGVTNEMVNARDSDGNYIGQLSAEVNCQTAKVTFTDSSDYTGWDFDSQLITVTPPATPATPSPTPVETPDSLTAEATFTYTNVTYTAVLSVVRSKNDGGEDLDNAVVFEWEDSVVATCTQGITCGDLGFCDLLPCVDSLFNKAYNAACERGGWDKVPYTTMAQLNAAMHMLTLSFLHNQCGEQSQSDSYRAKFEALLGTDCDCGCSGTTADNEPKPYTP